MWTPSLFSIYEVFLIHVCVCVCGRDGNWGHHYQKIPPNPKSVSN